jgi:hypothetical protein
VPSSESTRPRPEPRRARGRARQIRRARLEIFAGLYDGSSGHAGSSGPVVRCPRCRRTVGHGTGSGWRQAECDTCGAGVSMRLTDPSGGRCRRVKLLSPERAEQPDDDRETRRFALLEVD